MRITKNLVVYGKYRRKVLICAIDFGQALTLPRYQPAGPQALNIDIITGSLRGGRAS